jgi:hypothetical protein
MLPALHEIDDIYRQIQEYIVPSIGYLSQLTDTELSIWKAAHPAASKQYELAITGFRAIASQLSPEDIITAYHEGSPLLQMNLSGRIGQNFVPAYIPVMTWAIRAHHSHTSWLFLTALTQHLGHAATPLLLESLQSPDPYLRETALANVADISLIEAIPQLRQLLTDPVESVASLAQKVLRKLEAQLETSPDHPIHKLP